MMPELGSADGDDRLFSFRFEERQRCGDGSAWAERAAEEDARKLGIPVRPRSNAAPAAAAGLSPRALAIAGYRQEMLDMVRGLPEAAYELSLRDIVEPPAFPAADRESTTSPTTTERITSAEEMIKNKGAARSPPKLKKQRSISRTASLDTRPLIKLFLPLNVGGLRRKSFADARSLSRGRGRKVSPTSPSKKDKAAAAAGSSSDQLSASAATESSSRTSSTGSSSTVARNISRKRLSGCISLFRHKRKSKMPAIACGEDECR